MEVLPKRSNNGMNRGESTTLSPELSTLLSKCLKLELRQRLLWQIDAFRLRVWVADDDGVPVRPFLIILNELYPRGCVLSSRMPDRTPGRKHNVKPDATELAIFALKKMLDPAEGQAPVRPQTLHCSDESLVEPLRKIFSKIGVLVSYLSVAEGIDEHVKVYSRKLIEKDMATSGDAGELPGLYKVKGVGEDLALQVYRSLVEMYKAAPWDKGLTENLAFKTDFESNFVDNSVASFVTILGANDVKSRGFAAGNSVRVMKLKFMKATIQHGDNDIDAFADIEYRCAACGKEYEEGAHVFRCSGCKLVYYCSDECQRKDWKDNNHKSECSKWRDAKPGDNPPTIVRACWRRRELVLLFTEDVAAPFEDLDFIERHKLELPSEVVEEDDEEEEEGNDEKKKQKESKVEHNLRKVTLYPVPFVTVSGAGFAPTVVRPELRELRWMKSMAEALSHTKYVGTSPLEITTPQFKCTLSLASNFAAP
eukprot:CAMPEP_0184698702 /NCGR_PEP_ID=MMETSP0313-20130426/5222_1 /TAXON_ID=2792 /ORGANISM="Porphyridium aerugineum, Strain SAG 1380-2" /LENGTH=479 /DNA_ID=CAMNT_0027157673 /DNA_START=33 /DNA_END=1472 /DNA_ORIENTATION=+